MAEDHPYTWQPLTEEENSVVRENYGENSKRRDLIRSNPKLIVLGSSFKDQFHKVRNMKVRPDDVWVVTHPKCGTTWTQEMTWHIMTGVHLETTETKLFERSPFIDIAMIMDMKEEEVNNFFAKLDAMESPRLLKTHYPFELLPPSLLDTCKVLYVCRNVKDVSVSYFHHQSLMKSMDLRSDFIKFAREIYLPGLTLHGGYFEMLESGWKRRDNPNLMFFWYEEMKEDQEKMLRKIAEFIGYTITEDQIKELNEFMKFENYQKTSSLNKRGENWNEGKGQFIRKGIVGDWMNHFDPKLNEEYNVWILEHLDRIGLQDEAVRSYFCLDVEL